MVHIYQHNAQQVTATELHLDALWGALDELHTNVVEGELDQHEPDLLEWLREMSYMMQETIEELEARLAQTESQPTIRLLAKQDGANSKTAKQTAVVVHIVRRDDTG